MGDVVSVPGIIVEEVFAVPHTNNIGVDRVEGQGVFSEVVPVPVLDPLVEKHPMTFKTVLRCFRLVASGGRGWVEGGDVGVGPFVDEEQSIRSEGS